MRLVIILSDISKEEGKFSTADLTPNLLNGSNGHHKGVIFGLFAIIYNVLKKKAVYVSTFCSFLPTVAVDNDLI
jgi:hypothetical protein